MRSHNILILAAALATLTSCTLLSPAYGDGTEERPEPVAKIIDVHRHGTWPTGDDDAYRSQMLSEMSQNGVRLAVISITDYDDVEN